MKLQDRIALITGAASGFGEAGAVLFTREGAKVAVADIDDDRGMDVVSRIRELGGDAIYIHADVGYVAEVKNMIDTTVNAYGGLNIFWHNAGNAGPGRIEDTTEELYERTLNIHLKGAFFGAKLAISEIRKTGGGSILFTSSVAGYRPSVGSPTYSIAKAGLAILTRCLAVQLGKHNIRVNCIIPGAVKTGLWPLFVERDRGVTGVEGYEGKIMERTPLGRFGEVEDIAQAALYLASDDASFVTGAHLAVDGGMLAP